MRSVVIMRGLPGSGKTTYARQHFPTAAMCSADDYFMVDGEYRFDPTKLSGAHAACMRKFLEAIRQERAEIVVDNTNMQLFEVSPYVLVAEACGYDVSIAHIACAPATAAARTVHGAPLSTICKMASSFEPNLPWWKTIETASDKKGT